MLGGGRTNVALRPISLFMAAQRHPGGPRPLRPLARKRMGPDVIFPRVTTRLKGSSPGSQSNESSELAWGTDSPTNFDYNT